MRDLLLLKSENVILRPLRREDLAKLFEWINDRDLVQRSGPYHPISEKEHEAWFERVTAPAKSWPTHLVFGICLVTTSELIGTCQLMPSIPAHREAELQIRIGAADARGRGLGTEALRLLLKHAFADLNLHRVSLDVFATNAAAIRAYEKVGFVREGMKRKAAFIDGTYLDVVLMGILREDFAG